MTYILQNFIFWKKKSLKEFIMSIQNNLIIVIGSAKQRRAQITYIQNCDTWWVS
jgi:hypothetical protein